MTARKRAKKTAKTTKRSAKKGATKTSSAAATKRSKTAAKRAVAGTEVVGYKAAWRVANNAKQSDDARTTALISLGSAACDDSDVFAGLIVLLRDTATSLAVRLGVLAALQAASFSTIRFAACRPTYMTALRAVAKDPAFEMRQRALGLLMREGDGRAQTMLIEGLENPAKALLPPEKALQLLAYDVKSEAYPLARRIVERPPNADAKREALRLLAADAKSTKLFERILRDKSETGDVRQISAAALQSLAPEALQTYARDMVLDHAESPELQTMSLTLLTQFGDADALTKDARLGERVAALHSSADSHAVKQGAEQFIGKYTRGSDADRA